MQWSRSVSRDTKHHLFLYESKVPVERSKLLVIPLKDQFVFIPDYYYYYYFAKLLRWSLASRRDVCTPATLAEGYYKSDYLFFNHTRVKKSQWQRKALRLSWVTVHQVRSSQSPPAVRGGGG